MDDVTIVRALHVAAVVLWIGGVGEVTTVLLPLLCAGTEPAEPCRMFAAFERRFARQARLTVLIAGLSGFCLVHRLRLWAAIGDGRA